MVVAVLVVACGRRDTEQVPPRQPAAAARPSDTKQEDWSLYSARRNAQEELVIDADAIAAAHTDWPLVVAQLKELRRSDGRLSVTLALRNGGVEMQKPMFLYADVHIIDRNSGIRYGVLQENGSYLATTTRTSPDRFYEDAEPGETIEARMTFEAPPPEVSVVDLEIPNVRPLEGLTIADR